MAVDTSLGVDLALQGGDLALSGTGDYQLASGLQNLAQAMSLLIATNPGDYVWDPRYGAGLGAYVDAGMNQDAIDQATSQLQAAALSDPRVGSVVQASVTPVDSGELDVLLEVMPATSGPGSPQTVTVQGRVGS